MHDGKSLRARRDRAILELLYSCGLRRGELARLNLADVDFSEQRIFVRGKGDKERLLPVSDPAFTALTEYLHARRDKMTQASPVFSMTA